MSRSSISLMPLLKKRAIRLISFRVVVLRDVRLGMVLQGGVSLGWKRGLGCSCMWHGSIGSPPSSAWDVAYMPSQTPLSVIPGHKYRSRCVTENWNITEIAQVAHGCCRLEQCQVKKLVRRRCKILGPADLRDRLIKKDHSWRRRINDTKVVQFMDFVFNSNSWHLDRIFLSSTCLRLRNNSIIPLR